MSPEVQQEIDLVKGWYEGHADSAVIEELAARSVRGLNCLRQAENAMLFSIRHTLQARLDGRNEGGDDEVMRLVDAIVKKELAGLRESHEGLVKSYTTLRGQFFITGGRQYRYNKSDREYMDASMCAALANAAKLEEKNGWNAATNKS